MRILPNTTLPIPLAALLAIFGVIVSGCTSKGPPPTLYVLDSQAPAMLPAFEKGLVVGLGPVEVAPYLNRNQIVTRETASRLGLSEQHQWAEPLKDGFTRVLLVNLGVALDSNMVFGLPLRKRRDLDFEIPVEILRFDGDLGKEVVVGARWSVLDGNSQEILNTQVTVIRKPVAGGSYDDFVATLSDIMAQLGQEIAAAVEQSATSNRKP